MYRCIVSMPFCTLSHRRGMRRIWNIFWDMLFGCRHSSYSYPRTDPKMLGKPMYVVCWDCKERVPYDWDKMRVVRDHSVYAREKV